ncbi:MAG: hypothetical protein KDA49_02725 [Rhodospirillaceae bacterium]|nr:hypothetical protein [Rhodospirillaceae bacterium]MCA8931351.1 hypothetical protein [Rhodospirillaceae bacterium]
MSDWQPICVLPNVELQFSIGCEFAALVPSHDGRVEELRRRHPLFHDFLSRFSDNFGNRIEPAVILVKSGADCRYYSVDAVSSFRDAISIATIALGWANKLRTPHTHPILFGDIFNIYPWMIDRNYRDLIGNTFAFTAIDEVTRFAGQCSPSIFRRTVSEWEIDRKLLAVLLEHWEKYYESEESEWKDIALIRSLGTAFHATSLPSTTNITLYDFGPIVSLWVSAFEILAHPGSGGISNIEKVLGILEATPWHNNECGDRKFILGGKNKTERPIVSYLYKRLYDCRNNFVHGNPISYNDVLVPASKRHIFEYAAPLYRIMLTSFLNLQYRKEEPPVEDATAFGRYIGEYIEFYEAQGAVEKAILTAAPQDQ